MIQNPQNPNAQKPLPLLFDEAFDEISRARRILLVNPENPDPDSLGSLLAFQHWLRRLDKEVYSFSTDAIPPSMAEFPGIERLSLKLPELPIDVVIAFDYGDWNRLRISEWLANQEEAFSISFDHHPNGKHESDLQIIDVRSSSTAELAHAFFSHAKIDIDARMAEALLAGILDDTGGFLHANVRPATLRAVKDLIEKGASIPGVWKKVSLKKNPAMAPLWGTALLHLEEKNGIAFAAVTQKDFAKYGGDKEDLSGITDQFLMNVTGVRGVAMCMENADGEIKCSLRARADAGLDMSKIAKGFGGGGHILASGFKTREPIQAVLQKLKTLLG